MAFDEVDGNVCCCFPVAPPIRDDQRWPQGYRCPVMADCQRLPEIASGGQSQRWSEMIASDGQSQRWSEMVRAHGPRMALVSLDGLAHLMSRGSGTWAVDDLF